MKTRNALIAGATALALAAGGTTVPAHAEITARGFSVDVTTGDPFGFATAEVNKGRVSWLMYNSRTYGTMPTAFYLDAFTNGNRIGFAGDATQVSTSTTGGVDTVTMRHTDPALGVELVRTFTVTSKQIDIAVQLRNTGTAAKDLKLDLSTGLLLYDYEITAERQGSGFDLSVGGRYKMQTRYDGAVKSGTGGTQPAAVGGELKENSRFQSATWEKTVAPGEALSARVSVLGDSSTELVDSDGDGFPDAWERHGFTDERGKEFPLHRWGADPEKPDLFLQLNWMKSEWETLKCSEKRKYAPTEEDFAQFLECANANVNVYRPSRATLLDLVEIFNRRGINLHIDAGSYFNNIPGYTETHGGPTLNYEPYYFEGVEPGVRLRQDKVRLLGDRRAIFRVGIIGDTQAPGVMSSGNSLLSDGAFYVANNYLLTSQEQLRNTILHEFGHNLGLTHSGPANSTTNPPSNYVPNYESVMNYLYQFSHADYSDHESKYDPKKPLPEACRNNTVSCYNGTYNISPDWTNLDLINGEIGKTGGAVGVDDPPNTSGHNHPDTDELVVMAAEDNNGQAGFRALNQDVTPIMANRTDSKVKVEISNLGLDIHDFTLKVNYPGGSFKETYPIEGALSRNSKLAIDVPIRETGNYTDATMPVQFRVYNRDGKLVANETLNYSVLNLTDEEVEELRRELKEKNSSLIDDFNNTVGATDPAKPTPTKPTPMPTTGNNTIAPPTTRPAVTGLPAATTSTVNPRPTQRDDAGQVTVTAKPGEPSGSSANAGIIVGVVVALLAVLGMGAVAADAMGLLR
ncbi:hypothetical protein [Corynebacterium sp. Marseille-P4321]|uniref:hypothetical protein n=1 Tax=Corynebacterium sp. Marseille-P4321 TaxID=2736603 RepID=UPI00158D2C7A|nr:hypothetical protein [Corynebacterium sp. Marseille-P4321]